MKTNTAKVFQFPARHANGGAAIRTETSARISRISSPAAAPKWSTRPQPDSANVVRPINEGAAQPGWLLDAISDERVVVHYQPQYDLISRRVVSVEALVRLTDTRGELYYPDSFIEVAEESGLILALGRVVIKQVCRDLAEWRAQGLELASVAINLSASQLSLDDMLGPFIDKMLMSYDLAYSDLEFEITERQQLDHRGPGAETLRTLAHNGSRLALDDFGIGYSSISFLTELPIDTVKLDRSMVSKVLTDQTTQRVIHHLMNMAKDLGLKVIAEGIETDEQDDYLREVSCDLGQGFGFARPMPADRLAELIR